MEAIKGGARMFEVVRRLKAYTIKGYTVHALRDRAERLALLNRDKGACIGIYVIDTGHDNGLEVHILYATARALVCNYNTGLVCTGLFLAPHQMERYDIVSEGVKAWSVYNKEQGLNHL